MGQHHEEASQEQYNVSLTEKQWEELRILLHETLNTIDRSVEEIQKAAQLDETRPAPIVPQEIEYKKHVLSSFLDQVGYPDVTSGENEEELESDTEKYNE